MRRRQFITLLGGAAAAWPLAAGAEQANAVKRIGWQGTGAENDPETLSRVMAFQQEMQKLGWAVGRNLQIDIHDTASDENRTRAIAAELVGQGPDVIVATGTPTTAIFQQLTRTIPIVFVNVADPVASGFVASLARPGGNITGFIASEFSIAGKWLSIMKDVAPSTTRLMFLYEPFNSNWVGYLRTIEAAAQSLKVSVSAARVTAADEIVREVETFAREPGGAVLVQPGALTNRNRKLISDLAVQHRVPVMYPYGYYVTSGGLVSYGPDFDDQYRQAATYVSRILKGAKPADLPVQAPVKFELLINLKAAKAIGLEVPYNVLLLADKVID